MRQHPAGLSEFEIIQDLREKLDFLQHTEHNPWQLFHLHFLVFHSLYQLQVELASNQSGYLHISPLQILLTDYEENHGQNLAEQDKVRDFYLDINNLTDTSEDDVYSMLANFWNEMGRRDGREQALEMLGLSDPVDNQKIRQRYRKLVMQHHPDRGGDQVLLQDINHAMRTLIPKK